MTAFYQFHQRLIAIFLITTLFVLCTATSGFAGSCPCLGGVDNYCLYGQSYPDCAMTYPGGYCDPNGDGDFADADWVKGYYEYQAACPDGGTTPPPPPPSGGNDYSDWIYGIHWYGDDYAGTDVEAMTGGKGIWVMETVTTWDGWTVSDQLEKFNTIVDRGHTLILRIQPRWGWSIPAPGPERQQYLDAVEAAAQQAKDVCHIWQIGNEMNLYGEYGGGVLKAQEYIDYFKQIRQRIKNVSSSLGPQIVLVGPVSPGAYAGEVRHTDGLQYLGQMCNLLNANDFDGFALHAYGAPWLDANGARWDFQNGSGGYAAQLGVVDNHGFREKPAFILEWNRQTLNEEAGQEAQTAQFIIGAYQDLQTWNNNPNNHPVVCATWFIYADVGPWEIFSLRGLRDKNPRGVNQDVWDSFHYACSLNIPAGDLDSDPPTPPPPPNPGTPPGDNLALEAADWSASSVYSGDFGGDKATDGIISAGSKWTSDGSSAASWLALDLGTNSDITGFIVRHAGAAGESTGYNTRSYRLESGTSLSGSWTTLATVDNSAQQDSSTTVLANNVTTRYVRLYIVDAGIDNYARIPEFEVYGSAGSTPPPTAGPLTNGSFEGAVQDNGVGEGWYSFFSNGYGATYDVVSDPVYDGSSAQQVVSPQPSTNDQYAGVYQVVATESGSDYTVRAWNRTHFAGGSAWDHIARLGIDLTGGTDFQSDSVEWYEFDSAKDTWHQLELNLTATSSAMTIFLQSWRKWASGGGSLTWFDHVAVETDDQPPPPPADNLDAAHTGNTIPAAIQPNQTVQVSVTLKNTGSTPWQASSNDRLGASSDNALIWSGFADGGYSNSATDQRVFLAGGDAIATGGTKTFTFSITAPPVAGQYLFSARMVRDGVTWFGDTISKTVTVNSSGGGSLTNGEPKGTFGSGGQTDEVTEPENWRWSEWYYGFKGIDRIAWTTDSCGANHNYAMGWHKNDLIEYRMKFGGEFSRLVLRGLADQPGPVKLEIYIDGVQKATALWDNDDDCNQDAVVEIAGIVYGTHAIAVKFVNDYYDPGSGADRNFFLDGLMVARSSGQTQNQPPTARFSAAPTSGPAPLTVSFDAGASDDPDGDALTYEWNFGDGTQTGGQTPTADHTFETAGAYSVSLTVSDGQGGSDTASIGISVAGGTVEMPPYCPSTLNFAEIRSQLNQQGQDLAHVKIGFHVGPGGNQNGLGEWMACLDAAGVPFFLKSVDSAGQIWEAARLKAASGVPHVLVYRRSAGSDWNWDVPDYNKTPYDAAVEHWQRQREEFPPELEPYKHLIWIETINEVDKNRSEWLGEFAYHTAQMAIDQGFNWAAFGWSAGEPEREHWEGPWMQQFLSLAGQHPNRIAVALHEYSYVQDNLDRLYPHLVGRFQMLYDVCDTKGIPRPKVLVTEFGWVYDDIADSVQQAMEVDLPWAAEMYADYPNVLGAAIWYLGPGFGGIANQAQKLIAPLTEYALQNYFVVPLESTGPPPTEPPELSDTIGEVGRVIMDQPDLDTWHVVSLQNGYVNPVVIMQPPSFNGGQPVTIRLRNVTGTGFEFQLDEWDYLDGAHVSETMGYLVLEAGRYTLSGGARVEVGTIEAQHVFEAVTFNQRFNQTPVILSQSQTRNGSQPVVTRQQNATASGFEVQFRVNSE